MELPWWNMQLIAINMQHYYVNTYVVFLQATERTSGTFYGDVVRTSIPRPRAGSRDIALCTFRFKSTQPNHCTASPSSQSRDLGSATRHSVQRHVQHRSHIPPETPPHPLFYPRKTFFSRHCFNCCHGNGDCDWRAGDICGPSTCNRTSTALLTEWNIKVVRKN